MAIRIGGNGLGNLLFTWARCLVACEQNGWQMVWPTWASYKPKNKRVNPYDTRAYNDLFEPPEGVIRGLRKLWVLSRYRVISETEAPPASGSRVVQFRGMEGFFAPFLDAQPLVKRALLEMTREEHLAGYRAGNESGYPVAIHIRRGDFTRTTDERQIRGAHNAALPLDWYIAALQKIRAARGAQIGARVFSDGTADELSALLELPGVKRSEYGSGIADLLAMTQSRLLIASGSTFSMWASFLGQMPTLWFPDKLLQKVMPARPGFEFEWYPGQELPQEPLAGVG